MSCVEMNYYVTFMYFLFLIITNTYCGLLDYGRSYAHLFYSFYLEIRSVKCSPQSSKEGFDLGPSAILKFLWTFNFLFILEAHLVLSLLRCILV